MSITSLKKRKNTTHLQWKSWLLNCSWAGRCSQFPWQILWKANGPIVQLWGGLVGQGPFSFLSWNEIRECIKCFKGSDNLLSTISAEPRASLETWMRDGNECEVQGWHLEGTAELQLGKPGRAGDAAAQLGLGKLRGGGFRSALF